MSRSTVRLSVILMICVAVALRCVGAMTEKSMTMIKSKVVRLTVNEKAFGAQVVRNSMVGKISY